MCVKIELFVPDLIVMCEPQLVGQLLAIKISYSLTSPSDDVKQEI